MADLCEAHLERAGKEVPAYKLGLCEDCFRGKEIVERVVKVKAAPPPADCQRCGKPRHRGSCGGETRVRTSHTLHIDSIMIEHATALLVQGSDVGLVSVVSGVPRVMVEKIKTAISVIK